VLFSGYQSQKLKFGQKRKFGQKSKFRQYSKSGQKLIFQLILNLPEVQIYHKVRKKCRFLKISV